MHLTERDGTPLTIEVEVLGSMPLHVGCGYGGDPDWGHGQWRGRDWCERVVYDLTDPAIVGRTPFGVIDHAARVRCGDAVGYGIFEHGTVGRHDPSGFTDLMSVAPEVATHSSPSAAPVTAIGAGSARPTLRDAGGIP